MKFFILIFSEILFLSLFIFIFVSHIFSDIFGSPYVPLRKKSIKDILNLLEIKENVILYDLGSGDGRILISAVENFKIKKAVGYEISPWPYLKSIFLIKIHGLEDKIKILRQNFFKANLAEADFIYLYLFPKLVQNLREKFAKELKSGAKIISISFDINNYLDFNLKLINSGKINNYKFFIYEKT